jgi:uncharacterized protein YuzE
MKVRYFVDTDTLLIEFRAASQRADAPHFLYEEVAA